MPLVLEWGEKIDYSCVCRTESAFLLALFFLVLMCIYSRVEVVQKLYFKITK